MGNRLGTTIKYLRCTRYVSSGSSLGATIKYLKQLSRATARPPRSSTCVAPWASAWEPRLSTRDAQRRNGQGIVRRTTSGVAGKGQGISIKYLRRTTSGAAGNGPSTTTKYLRRTTSGAAGNGLGTTIKYLRRIASGAAGNGLGSTIKYLRRTTSGATGIDIEDF